MTRPPCWLTAYPREMQTYETLYRAVNASLLAAGELIAAQQFSERAEQIPLEHRDDYGELLHLAIEYVEVV